MSKLFDEMIVTEEDSAIVSEVTSKSITMTIPAGCAIVAADVLQQAAVAIAKDAVMAAVKGEKDDAEMLALMGLEVHKVITTINDALLSIDGADKLLEIARRSSDNAKAAKENNAKGTLQ